MGEQDEIEVQGKRVEEEEGMPDLRFYEFDELVEVSGRVKRSRQFDADEFKFHSGEVARITFRKGSKVFRTSPPVERPRRIRITLVERALKTPIPTEDGEGLILPIRRGLAEDAPIEYLVKIPAAKKEVLLDLVRPGSTDQEMDELRGIGERFSEVMARNHLWRGDVKKKLDCLLDEKS